MPRFGLVVIGALVTLAITRYVIGGFDLVVAICVLVTVYASERLLSTNTNAAHAKTWALNMPRFLVVIYIVILCPMILLALPNKFFDPQTNANILAFGLAWIVGWCTGLADWYITPHSKK